ncbi:MAG: serine hydrolase domain-containing protein [bacterium]
MKKQITILLALTAITLSSCGTTQGNLHQVLSSEWNTFSQSRKDFSGGLAMQIISPKGDYFVSTGMGIYTSNKQHFRTASCTKTFTGAAIMLLNQQGKLNIDDKLTDNIPGTDTPYLPATSTFNIPYKDQITIRMVLMHRAGIFDVSNQALPGTVPAPYTGVSYINYIEEQDPNHQFTFDELIGVDATYQISNFVPDTKYQYSNTGYSVLGKIVERVTGQTYADFVTAQLIVPNKLFDSVMVVDSNEQSLPVPYADGYAWDGTNSTNVTLSNMSPHVAEGNLTTTPKDLATWIYKLLRSEAGLNSTTVDMMKNGSATGTGTSTYGLSISHTDLNGYGHSGAHAGYLTIMFYHPETDVAYVMFTNGWDYSNGQTSILAQIDYMTATANKVLAKLGY